ncbi:hypothetical protein [Haloechinothrix salitolerans]|uniref:Uncharacterized protein n=1 Tax=Haloechinothrix salitolerans TaxID=926830 RepID=A0ABW2C7T9_9PSEU
MVGRTPASEPNATAAPDPYALREQHWPLLRRDPELTETAAVMAAELVRYLNHATNTATNTGANTALPYASNLYTLLGHLAAAAHGMEQLCEQLNQRAAALATDPTLRHDGHRGSVTESEHAEDAAWRAVDWLAEAGMSASYLGGTLRQAQKQMTWLSHAAGLFEAGER